MLMQSSPRTVLILDAIDECNNVRTLSEVLVKLSTRWSTKIILFSRYSVHNLIQSVPSRIQVAIGRDLVSKDIQSFFSHAVENLLEDGLLMPLSDVVHIVTQLVTGADGMFLWARLIVNFLNLTVLTPARRLRVITDVVQLEGLENMYHRILAVIEQSGTTTCPFTKRVYTWLCHAARPLEIDELERALMLDDRQEADHDDRIIGYEATIYPARAGLVKCTTLWNSDFDGRCPRIFRFIHLSAKDYLLSHDDSVRQSTRKGESRRTFVPPAAVCHSS